MKVDKAREASVKIMYEIEEKNAYSNLVLDSYLNTNRDRLTIKDISLISELVYGTVSWKITIDTIIQKYAKIKLNKISKWILAILRIGVYQILFLDKIPKSAAVNESVNLAKKYGAKSTGFVNAILRKVEKKDYEELDTLSLKYSMPQWLVVELQKSYSIEEVEKICQASNIKPKTTIRINTLKIGKEQLKEELKERNIEYEEIEDKDFLHLKIKNIANLDLYQKGYFTIQDLSAGMVSRILNPLPNQFVLDSCSAPGGKTTHLAEIMNNEGKIMAWDLYSHRLQLVEENANRLEIHMIETQVKDASIFDDKLVDRFDKILLDVPCLGIGVIKRKPDIKWQRKPQDILEITKMQKQILEICSKYLKPEGELVYSTCSILKQENEDIINDFLSIHQDWDRIEKHTILPNESQDGFFICKIKRNK